MQTTSLAPGTIVRVLQDEDCVYPVEFWDKEEKRWVKGDYSIPDALIKAQVKKQDNFTWVAGTIPTFEQDCFYLQEFTGDPVNLLVEAKYNYVQLLKIREVYC